MTETKKNAQIAGAPFGEYLEVERRGRIGVIKMTRDFRGNSVDLDQLANIEAALDCIAECDRVRSVLLTNAGSSFCTGIDVSFDAFTTAEGFIDTDLVKEVEVVGSRVCKKLINGKPVIAAANGKCLGLGLVLLSCCDYRIATRGGYFSIPDMQLGIFPGASCISVLTRMLGPILARRIVLWGAKFEAEEALELGLVDQLADGREDLLSKARSKARFLATKNEGLIRAVKTLLNRLPGEDLDAAHRTEQRFFRAFVDRGKENVLDLLEENFGAGGA
jgi:enoyl-CoA hydratase/carnithine racemase